MRKCTKQVALERVDVICELLAVGTSDAAIRRHPRVAEWGLKTKQVGRYIKIARQVLIEKFAKDREGALGLAHKRFDTILLMAMKDKKLSTALQAVKAGLMLMGLSKPGRSSASGGQHFELTHDAVKLTDADRGQRLAQIIDYEARGDQSAVDLMMDGMPAEYFRVVDILLMHWQLHILLECHLRELTEQLALLQRVLRMAASDQAPRWKVLVRMLAYCYQTNVEGWADFTRSIGVDATQLLGHESQWKSLQDLRDPIIDQPISRQQLKSEIKAAGIELPRLVSSADLAARWERAYHNREERLAMEIA